MLESARADLQESVRIAAEAAAKPIAEAAARAVIEQVARETLAAVLEEEAASRSRVEQTTIAIAERVGRELVQLAFSAATSNRNGAPGAIDRDPNSTSDTGEEPSEDRARAGATAAGMAATHQVPSMPAPRTAPAAVLPWLGALTLVVLYLLGRTFF
jgi:cobalamin biosynthesis Mg chelatase CobN